MAKDTQADGCQKLGWKAIGRTTLLTACLIGVLTVAAACAGGDRAAGSLISEGGVAPEFALPAADGENVTLSEYAGDKSVLLYFSMGSG